MKKIIYICNTRLPTEKAHGLATVKICEALAEEGWQVDLVVPRFWNISSDKLFSFYGVKRNFTLRTIPCINLIHLIPWPRFEWLTFLVQIFSFSILELVYLPLIYNRKTRCEAIFISHDYIPLAFASLVGRKVFYDIHHFPGANGLYRMVMRRSFAFAVQTKWKVAELKRVWNIGTDKIVYWPNGTDVELFQKNISKAEARIKLKIAQIGLVVLYTGQLFKWKGVDTLLQSVVYLKKEASLFIVGGSSKDVLQMRKDIPEASDTRVHFINFRPHDEIAIWQKAADVLVLPNTGKQKVSLYYTSPMKLFEYMASGRPIVASNIPSIAEILNESNALLVFPDNPLALAQSINSLLENRERGEQLATQALKDVQKYTWRKRAQKIIQHINETV